MTGIYSHTIVLKTEEIEILVLENTADGNFLTDPGVGNGIVCQIAEYRVEQGEVSVYHHVIGERTVYGHLLFFQRQCQFCYDIPDNLTQVKQFDINE